MLSQIADAKQEYLKVVTWKL